MTCWVKIVSLPAFCGCLIAVSGCVSKSQAQRQAREAYLAGQQSGMELTQQNRGPVVTLRGRVKAGVVPWSLDLTLARALIAAEYYGGTPAEIILTRNGQQIPVDPNSLLNGQDVPLEPRDVIEIKEAPADATR